MGDRVLALAVVVHGPDLLHAGARGDVVDLGLGDAVHAAAEAEDDLVRELVGDQARIVLRGHFAVLLADDGGRAGLFDVDQIAVDVQAAALHGERAKREHGSIGGRGRPLREVDLRGSCRGHGRSQALRNHVEDAGVREVVIEGVIEGRFEDGRLRIGGVGLEVRCGHADLFDAEVGAGSYPVLCMDGRSEWTEASKEKKGEIQGGP